MTPPPTASRSAGSTRGERSRRAAEEEPPPRGNRKDRSEARRRDRLRKMRARSGNRYRIHYDTDGPRVRLGIAWFLCAMASFVGGPPTVALVFGVACAAAASHCVRTWRARGAAVDPRVALVATAATVAAAVFGPQAMGVALLGSTALVLVLASGELRQGEPAVRLLARASLVLQSTVPTAVAGGCLVLVADRSSWAAMSLVLLCSAYETGDYLIGSGSANAFEGPLAGAAAVAVMALAVAALGFPPFSIGQALSMGVAVAPLAVAGQYLASAMLPHSRAYAPALRRVDSLLLAAPLWYLALDQLVL